MTRRALSDEFEGWVDDSNPYLHGPVSIRRRNNGVEIDAPDLSEPLSLSWAELAEWARGVVKLQEIRRRMDLCSEMEQRAELVMALADRRHAETLALADRRHAETLAMLERPVAVVCRSCKAASIRRIEMEELQGEWS